MVILKDEAGRYLLINKRVEEFFGRSAAELEGKTNSALLSAAKAAEAARVDREVLASGGIRRYQEVMHNKDGEARDVEVVKVPLRDEKGRLFGLIFTGTDVTSVGGPSGKCVGPRRKWPRFSTPPAAACALLTVICGCRR